MSIRTNLSALIVTNLRLLLMYPCTYWRHASFHIQEHTTGGRGLRIIPLHGDILGILSIAGGSIARPRLLLDRLQLVGQIV